MVRVAASALVIGVVLAAPASAQISIPGWDPNWLSASVTNIQVSNLEGTFTLGGGWDDMGTLSVSAKSGGPSISLYWDTGDTWTLSGTQAVLEAVGNLYNDESGTPPLLPGQASGWFNGLGVKVGSANDTDWRLGWDFGLIETWVLSGALDVYRVREIFNYGTLEGSGLVTATDGILVDFGLWPVDQQTSISSFTFGIEAPGGGPINIDDFQTTGFTGDMFMTFWPDDDHGVPEPATLALLASGFGLIAVRRRR